MQGQWRDVESICRLRGDLAWGMIARGDRRRYGIVMARRGGLRIVGSKCSRRLLRSTSRRGIARRGVLHFPWSAMVTNEWWLGWEEWRRQGENRNIKRRKGVKQPRITGGVYFTKDGG